MRDLNNDFRCTITGVDAATDLHRVAALSVAFPFAEWAFLYSPSRSNREPRYPSLDTLSRMLSTLSHSVPVALHLCGGAVDEFVANQGDTAWLVGAVAGRHGRCQVNVNLRRRTDLRPEALDAAIRRFPGEVMLQHNASNRPFLGEIVAPNRAYLFDASGGRGIAPRAWPARIPGIRCGYAGGLGPDSLDQALPQIFAASGDKMPDWIDMETRVRDHRDCLDLDQVARALEAAERFLFASVDQPGQAAEPAAAGSGGQRIGPSCGNPRFG